MLNIAKFDSNELPINEGIKFQEVMVIGPNGEKMGLKNIKDALTLANYAGLDLVLMNGNGVPPVTKIMDYNKYRYEKQKKLKNFLLTMICIVVGIELLQFITISGCCDIDDVILNVLGSLIMFVILRLFYMQ